MKKYIYLVKYWYRIINKPICMLSPDYYEEAVVHAINVHEALDLIKNSTPNSDRYKREVVEVVQLYTKTDILTSKESE